jgi:uncharacterized protein (DUF1501 family)
MPDLTRRALLAALSATAALPSVSFAAPAATDTRTLVVLLRGGLDGLALAPRIDDRSWSAARGDAHDDRAPLPIDDGFGLHPALAPLERRYRTGELLVVHATGLPYDGRSHFDAQDMLETGHPRPMASASGWLDRAVCAAGPLPAWAFGRSVPLILRGEAGATSLDPTRRARRDDGRLQQVRQVLSHDPLLGPSLEEGLATRRLLDEVVVRRSRQLSDQALTLAHLMALPQGPRVATLELTGFDTHTRQQGTLDRQLGQLAEGLASFADALPDDVWRRTVVVCVTEFGRTVAGNGTGGTDHGVGGAALVFGGTIAGGVHADWPGLGHDDLLEGRDLAVTTDLRAVLGGVLSKQLGLSRQVLADTVFPGSHGLRPLAMG